MTSSKVRIRDDDVLLPSSRWAEPMRRFKGFHNLVCQDTEHFIHVPAILVTEIQDFPEAIELIKAETANGRMEPQLHGLKHIDYGALSFNEVMDHLDECFQFFRGHQLPKPTIWYTPWGASQDHLHVSAEARNLRLVGTSGIIHPGVARDALNKHKNPEWWQGREIFRHWWESVGALNEFVLTYKKLTEGDNDS